MAKGKGKTPVPKGAGVGVSAVAGKASQGKPLGYKGATKGAMGKMTGGGKKGS